MQHAKLLLCHLMKDITEKKSLTPVATACRGHGNILEIFPSTLLVRWLGKLAILLAVRRTPAQAQSESGTVSRTDRDREDRRPDSFKFLAFRKRAIACVAVVVGHLCHATLALTVSSDHAWGAGEEGWHYAVAEAFDRRSECKMRWSGFGSAGDRSVLRVLLWKGLLGSIPLTLGFPLSCAGLPYRRPCI